MAFTLRLAASAATGRTTHPARRFIRQGQSMAPAIIHPFRNLIEKIAAQNIKTLAFAPYGQDILS
ncbi:MAG: hypothetical protein P8Y58_16770 [Novosphingobium sp.]